MSSLKVAIAQIRCEPAELSANLAMHLDAIARARGQGAELLLFPELSLTDYLVAPDCGALALRPDADPLARLAEAADGITVSAGFIERGEEGPLLQQPGPVPRRQAARDPSQAQSAGLRRPCARIVSMPAAAVLLRSNSLRAGTPPR
jgi:predicted amidohydrolase